MFLKQSLILLFVGTFASALATEIEDYDIDSLRRMLRSQSECPNYYVQYTTNCTQIYQHGIDTCDNNAASSKAVLDKKSLETQKVFHDRVDATCQDIVTCEKNIGDKFFTCFAEKSAATSVDMNNMQFEANSRQSEYLSDLSKIQTVQTSCTNENTQALSVQNALGVNELQNCFRTGEWKLVALLPEIVPPTIAPVDFDKSEDYE